MKSVQDGNHREVEKILETNNEWINFRYTICLTLNMTQENSNTIQNGFKELNDLEKNSSLLSQQRFFIEFIQKKFQVLIFLPIVLCNSHYSLTHLQAEFYFYGCQWAPPIHRVFQFEKWGCIRMFNGLGSIKEWGSNNTDTA